MRILITGATGLIGQQLVAQCHSRKISVNYLTTSREKIVLEDNYSGFFWNPDKNEIDLECFNGVSAIINLAGTSISNRWTKKNKAKILSSRIHSLRTLRQGLEKSDISEISSFVSASAIGIYPHSFSEFYTEEEEQIDNSFLGDVVKAWEKEIDTFERLDIKVAKIRIGLVLSSEGGALPEMVTPIKNYVGAAFGSGKQWQSWIHIQDLARIFLFVIDEELEGVFNGVAPNPISNQKLTKELARVLQKPLFLPNIPQFMMKFILGEMSYLLFASQRVSSKKIEGEGFDFKFGNISTALEALFLNKKSQAADALYD